MAFETRDPFLIRQVNLVIFIRSLASLKFLSFHPSNPEQERENPTLTEWDRFAHREYIRLSMEEDAEDGSYGSADVWDESLETPF